MMRQSIPIHSSALEGLRVLQKVMRKRIGLVGWESALRLGGIWKEWGKVYGDPRRRKQRMGYLRGGEDLGRAGAGGTGPGLQGPPSPSGAPLNNHLIIALGTAGMEGSLSQTLYLMAIVTCNHNGQVLLQSYVESHWCEIRSFINSIN